MNNFTENTNYHSDRNNLYNVAFYLKIKKLVITYQTTI